MVYLQSFQMPTRDDEENYFADPEILNLYKGVLFTEGDRYASEKAKNNYNFAIWAL